LTPLPTQRAFSLEKKADENGNARDEGNDAFAVVLGDAPPLGAAVVVAIDRDRLTPSGASNDEISIRPEDMGVTFDAHGATIEFSFASSGPAGSSRSRKKSFARLSAAAVAFPRDEHFGDGPYVSRSAAAHVFLLWVASVIGYVVGDVGVRWVLETRSWKPTRTRLFATLPTGEKTAKKKAETILLRLRRRLRASARARRAIGVFLVWVATAIRQRRTRYQEQGRQDAVCDSKTPSHTRRSFRTTTTRKRLKENAKAKRSRTGALVLVASRSRSRRAPRSRSSRGVPASCRTRRTARFSTGESV
jgi:hypothetical protein